MAQLQAMIGTVCSTMQPIALVMVTIWLAFVGVDIAFGHKTLPAACKDFAVAACVIVLLQAGQYTQYISDLFLTAVPNTVGAALGGTTSPAAGLDKVLNLAWTEAAVTYKGLSDWSLKTVAIVDRRHGGFGRLSCRGYLYLPDLHDGGHSQRRGRRGRPRVSGAGRRPADPPVCGRLVRRAGRRLRDSAHGIGGDPTDERRRAHHDAHAVRSGCRFETTISNSWRPWHRSASCWVSAALLRQRSRTLRGRLLAASTTARPVFRPRHSARPRRLRARQLAARRVARGRGGRCEVVRGRFARR